MSMLSTMHAPTPAADRLRDIRGSLHGRFAAWKVYRTTYAELSALPDRELADLGLRRSELRRVAREAAYGE